MIGKIGLQLAEHAVAKPPKAKPKRNPLFANAAILEFNLSPNFKLKGSMSRLAKPK